MRQIAVDRARFNLTQKRGGGIPHVSIDDEQLSCKDDRHVLALEDALKRLEEVDPEASEDMSSFVFFGGMTVEEVAETIGKSKRWVEAEWDNDTGLGCGKELSEP